jgi:hypothetical protein
VHDKALPIAFKMNCAKCALITEKNYEELAKLGILKGRTMKNRKREYYYLGITSKQPLRGKKVRH